MIKVRPSDYVLQAKGMDFADRRRTSRIRTYSSLFEDPVLGAKVGEASTDTGMIAVFDMSALDEAIDGDNDGFQELVMNQDYGNCGVVKFQMKDSIRFPYITTGFGDCTFTAFELRSGSELVGLEVEFLHPRFVFGDDEE